MHILVVEDQVTTRRFYEICLKQNHTVVAVANGVEALKQVADRHFDLYVVDLMMPGMSGIETIRKLKDIHPDPTILVISQTEDLDLAIDAFHEQPVAFLRKPVTKPQLIHTVKTILNTRLIRSKLDQLSKQTAIDANCPDPVLSVSGIMSGFWENVRKISGSRLHVPVLLSGESGVGKDVVARRLHSLSSRCAGPFVTVNCGLMRSELAASDLLGIEKGIATGVEARSGKFMLADKGSLFLDEIAELPLDVQPVLLRVLQDNIVYPVGGKDGFHVDVRIIAATNKNLPQLVREGKFREDLYYRLSVVQLVVPPLRDRKQEIPELLEHLYRRHGGEGALPLTGDELDQWMQLSWPGNIRQLESALINRMISSEPLDPSGIFQSCSTQPTGNEIDRWLEGRSWKEIKEAVYRHVLSSCEGNTRRAASRLKISHTAMWEFSKKHYLK
jgi:DNA-binding NtrC family response regulator